MYRQRTQPVQAWQCGRDMPAWVMLTCVVVGDDLVLDRPSGRQVVNPGEWLVRDLDGGVTWFPPEEFEECFEEIAR